jgi:hypothetical protein
MSPTPELGDDAHPFGHIEAGTPEVDQVPASASFGRVLDERGLVPGAEQPVGQRRSRDSRADDEHLHDRTVQTGSTGGLSSSLDRPKPSLSAVVTGDAGDCGLDEV